MDNTVIEKVKRGDTEAFAIIYEEYAEYALRLAKAVTGSSEMAADAVQEAFIRVYRNITGYQTDKPFKPWLYRILVNECRRLMQKRPSTIPIDGVLEHSQETARPDEHHFEEYEELYKAIEELPEVIRLPVVLKYLNGFSERDIAEITGSNLNTVKSRLLRGRQKLKETLKQWSAAGGG